MATTVEELNIVIDLDTAPLAKGATAAKQQFTKNFDKMENATKKLNVSVKRTGGGLGAITAKLKTMIAPLAAAFGTMKAFNNVLTSMDAKDALGKTADKLGIVTQELVALRLAAEQTAGVTSQTFDTALQRMVRRVSEAKEGFGEAKGALQELGLDLGRLGKLSPDEQFKTIAEAMSKVANQGDRVRLSMKLFDTEGVALVNTLSGGRAVLDEFAAKTERLGIAVSRIDSKRAEIVNDAFSDMQSAIDGIFNVISKQLEPAFFAFAKVITEIAIKFRQNQEAATGFGDVAMAVIGGVAQTVHALLIAWEGAKLAVLGYTTLVVGQMALVANVITDIVTRVQGMGQILEGIMEDPGAAFEAAMLGMKQFAQEMTAAVVIAFADMIKSVSDNLGGLDTGIGSQFRDMAENVKSAGLTMEAGAAITGQAIQDMTDKSAGLQKVNEGMDKVFAAFDPTKAKSTGINFIDGIATGLNDTTTGLAEATAAQFNEVLATANMFGGQTAYSFTQGMKDVFDNELNDAMPGLGGDAPKIEPIEDERVIRERMVQEELLKLNQDRIDQERKDFVTQQTFWQSSLQNRLSTASSILGDLSTLMQSKSKKMFEIGKIAAISQAVVDTFASANKAMSTLPYPLNLAAAAATTAAGMVNVQNIRSQQFSKGGGSSSSASSAGSIGAVGEGGGGGEPVNNTNFNIALQGQSFGNQQIRSLITQINDNTDDNVRLNVTQRVD